MECQWSKIYAEGTKRRHRPRLGLRENAKSNDLTRFCVNSAVKLLNDIYKNFKCDNSGTIAGIAVENKC